MKISILSLGVHGTNENYGAVLQILAFQELMKKTFNADVNVINYYGLSTVYPQTNLRHLKIMYKSIRKKINSFRLNTLERRCSLNEKFIRKNLNTTNKYTYKTIGKADFGSDIYIAESDVIWDPSFRKTGFDDAYFLNCDSFMNGKRIVYAASLGDIKFSESEKKDFLCKIRNIDKWSVREDYAREYIKDQFKIECESLIDPTLFFDKSFYSKYEEKSERIDKLGRYVLVYFPAENNDIIIKKALEYCKQKRLNIIFVSRNNKGIEKENVILDMSIGEFLYAINNSELILCDSFHGICLSIIYQKNFFSFMRDDGKKVIDICSRLNIVNRCVDEKSDIDDSKIDYDSLLECLNNERKKGLDWLKNAINIDYK